MECYICSKRLAEGYLCHECCNKAMIMLKDNFRVDNNPDWKNHCLICGEYENRTMIDLPSCGPICDKCIKEESKRYVDV